ncbi:hypothetical protein DSM25558_4090 [Agrobacterium sp. DSM 25558]|nr:hypothetical protein DSM25558_4090 [Agrobacterium sp. DSM 25558]
MIGNTSLLAEALDYAKRSRCLSSPRRGEGGPKGRMRGPALLIHLPLPPHPAAATFSPSGRRRKAARSHSKCDLPTLISMPRLLHNRKREA